MLRRIDAVLVACCSATMLLAACSTPLAPVDRSSAVEPSGSGWSAAALPNPERGPDHDHTGFYPLEVGNRWSYHEVVVVRLEYLDGRPPVETSYDWDLTWELTSTMTFQDHEYVLQKETLVDDNGPHVYGSLKRQDLTGLYEFFQYSGGGYGNSHPDVWRRESGSPVRPEALVSTWRIGEGATWSERVAGRLIPQLRRSMSADGAAFVCAGMVDDAERVVALAHGQGRPGGIQPNEIPELIYPLRIGQHWVLDTYLGLEQRVVGKEVRDVLGKKTLMYRIRMIAEYLGETTVDYLYSRRGFVGSEVAFKGVRKDLEGNIIGITHTTEALTLTAIHLDRPSSLEGELRVAE